MSPFLNRSVSFKLCRWCVFDAMVRVVEESDGVWSLDSGSVGGVGGVL